MTSVSTASLDYAGASQGPAAAFKQRRADLNALKTALQSGDLAGAQKAFAALQQDLQSAQGAAGQRGDASGQSSTLAKDSTRSRRRSSPAISPARRRPSPPSSRTCARATPTGTASPPT